MNLNNFYGRIFTQKQISTSNIIQLKLSGKKALIEKGKYVECQRCYFKNLKAEVKLPNNEFYCRNCIQLGRITSLDMLYHLNEPNIFDIPQKVLTWKGTLSPYQTRCAQELCKKVKQKKDHLIWAVTGAGKTEMLFPMLEENLKAGKRIAIASPRIDVCNELYPRLQSAFKNIKIALLHGKSSMKYFYAQLTICTTHQLMKFKHAFDILVIDEIDSFPFVNDHNLHLTAERSCKKDGVKIYLTATPDEKSMQLIKQKKLSVGYLPLRFHQFPLPEIKFNLDKNLYRNLKKKKLSQFVKNTIQKWEKQGTPFLIFVPELKYLDPVLRCIQSEFPNLLGESVYAADPQRIKKIQALRDGKLRFLVTTTILERGVTFKNLDLMVYGAENNNFTCSSLVQIAGRVGRNKTKPDGDVYFIVKYYNQNVKKAAGQIKYLNRKARKLLNEY